MKAISEDLSRQLSNLPDSSGVYVFKDGNDDIIYIGKAVSLRNRVRSYWNETSWRERPKLAVMIPKVMSLDLILTNSEKEALLLEATLIRQHMPRYNVALKDDKKYPWLAITYDVAFPRLVMVRDPVKYRKEHPRARVFGPYVETGVMWETVRMLRKVFPMRQRKKPLFKDRPCMNYYIGLCLGPCQSLVTEDAYSQITTQVEMFLAGRQGEVISMLRGEMEAFAEKLEFEQAAKIRNRLQSLERVVEKQQVFFQSQKVSQDIIAEAHTNRYIAVCLMRVREGKLISAETVVLPLVEKTSADEAFESFVDQYYASCEDIAIPGEVILQQPLEEQNALLELLNAKAQRAVKILVPQRGLKQSSIEMAQKNAKLSLEKELQVVSEEDAKLQLTMSTLQEDLRLTKQPRRIECFDISNIQGTDNVASMVVFENATSKKSDYRRFKIRSVEGIGEANDFASMKEAVGRRYSRLVAEGKPLPDLIIIDGGKGQLGAACEALQEANIPFIDIVGLAKRQEEVYKPTISQPFLLPRRSEALFLLQRVRDEAHRFAVTYHRQLRAKRSISSNLDILPGIGKARRKVLLDHFGTFDKIKAAPLADLMICPGLPKNVGKQIYFKLHPDEVDASANPGADEAGATVGKKSKAASTTTRKIKSKAAITNGSSSTEPGSDETTVIESVAVVNDAYDNSDELVEAEAADESKDLVVFEDDEEDLDVDDETEQEFAG
ncbi:MAG TPA: excinuclease ABC subunit UvrC [Drouetiella sp.]